jgi:hypothetical protein
MSEKKPMFPILGDTTIKAIPWEVVQPHELQATRNHSQTLKRLAQRGGLGIEEAYYILRDEPWPTGARHNKHRVRWYLMMHIAKFYDARAAEVEAGG